MVGGVRGAVNPMAGVGIKGGGTAAVDARPSSAQPRFSRFDMQQPQQPQPQPKVKVKVRAARGGVIIRDASRRRGSEGRRGVGARTRSGQSRNGAVSFV